MANIMSLYGAGDRILKWGPRHYATPTPDLMDGLYSWYRADGNTNDATGSYNAQSSIVSYGAGKIGQAFSMNGLTNRVELPDNTHTFPLSFSVSAWVNINALGTAYVLSNYQTSGSQKGFLCGYNSVGAITFGGWYSGISIASAASPNGSLTTGSWHHLVWVYQVGTSVRIYKNGTQVATAGASQQLNYSSTAWPVIGASHYNGVLYGSFVDGSIDMVGTWTKALAVNEIQWLYNQGLGRNIL